jgi:putative transcriptional regulator
LRHKKASDKIIGSLKWLFDRHRRCRMAVSYNKLWKILIDRGMNKTQLCERAKISTNAMAKLGRNEDVRVEVLTRICVELGCSLDDIMEIITEE